MGRATRLYVEEPAAFLRKHCKELVLPDRKCWAWGTGTVNAQLQYSSACGGQTVLLRFRPTPCHAPSITHSACAH